MKKMFMVSICAVLLAGVTIAYAQAGNVLTTDNPKISGIPDNADAESFERVLEYKVNEDVNAPVKDIELSIAEETTALAQEYDVETNSKTFIEDLANAMQNEVNEKKKSLHRGFLVKKELVENGDLSGASYNTTLQDGKKIWRVEARYPNGYMHPKAGLIKNAIATSYYDANTGEELGTEINNVDATAEN
jgi:hypothetical protein